MLKAEAMHLEDGTISVCSSFEGSTADVLNELLAVVDNVITNLVKVQVDMGVVSMSKSQYIKAISDALLNTAKREANKENLN